MTTFQLNSRFISNFTNSIYLQKAECKVTKYLLEIWVSDVLPSITVVGRVE